MALAPFHTRPFRSPIPIRHKNSQASEDYIMAIFVCESTSRSREAIRAKKHSVKYACQNSRPTTDHLVNLAHSSCDWGEPGAALRGIIYLDQIEIQAHNCFGRVEVKLTAWLELVVPHNYSPWVCSCAWMGLQRSNPFFCKLRTL